MTLIKLSKDIAQISGQCGGIYFAKNRSGQHIQAMPKRYRQISCDTPIIAPHSPGGSRAWFIKKITQLFSKYAGAAVILAIDLWLALAAKEKYKTKKGVETHLNSRQLFLHINMRRTTKNLPIYTRPPRSIHFLPDFVMDGNFWYPETVNLYKYMDFDPENPVYYVEPTPYNSYSQVLFKHDLTWYIAETTEWPIPGHYWYLNSISPAGIYEENAPEYGTLEVNL